MASRLADSASPYLRAHAGNPVAWYPWGDEAFAEAARRDVPVFVSIGYSTCHWCHVMARESFEDAETAAELNQGFVAIKVDREEHPDVDEAYLAAASAFTPNLGWPLSVFATPDGRAFYAGTYFPPAPRAGSPSFRQVLAAVREAWTERRAQVDRAARSVVEALGRLTPQPAGGAPAHDDLVQAASVMLDREDVEYGGFAAADASMTTPKFPSVPALRFLQTPGLRMPQASGAARRALAAMAGSPLRDPVDGGFFRYATRRDWTVPHYERMLTDNAGLIEVALDAGDTDTARGIAGFLLSVLQQPSGGFGAAQDSESWIDGTRSEGGFYARDAAGRSGLEPPAVDGKVVTGWNGLAIGALARAGLRLGDPRLVEAARWAADAVLEANVADDGRLRRASLDDVVSPAAASLEDYGLLAAGLIALSLATGEAAYASRARMLVDACLADPSAPGVPGGGDPVLAARGIPAAPATTDADHASGPSALADAALALWQLGAGDAYRTAAETLVRANAARALVEPLAHGALLRVAAGLSAPPRQLVVIGAPDAPLTRAVATEPADVFAVVSAPQARALADAGFSLFEGKTGDVATLYDCRDFACRLPTTSFPPAG